MPRLTASSSSSPHRQPGLLVAVDGPSGVGKSTITRMVTDRLTGHGVAAVATRQPSDSPMGALARASTHALHGLALSFLMAADRHHHQDHTILPRLCEGEVVVCDRYVATALVLDQMDGADPDFILAIYQHMVRPDLAVVLTGDPAVCRARAEVRGTYSRFHEGGAEAGRREAELFADAGALLAAHGYPVCLIDTTGRTAPQVADDVLDRVLALCDQKSEQAAGPGTGRAAS